MNEVSIFPLYVLRATYLVVAVVGASARAGERQRIGPHAESHQVAISKGDLRKSSDL